MHSIIFSLIASVSWAGTPIQQNGISNVTPNTITVSTIIVTNTGTSVAVSTAQAPLQVQMNGPSGLTPASPTTDALILENGTTNGTIGLEFLMKGTSSPGGQILFTPGATADRGAITYTVGAADNMVFKAQNTEIYRITSVGMHIGTAANPVGPLDVEGTTQGVGIPVLTQVQVRASTPARAGMIIYNSGTSSVCVSTGTAIMSYARIDGAAAACGL